MKIFIILSTITIGCLSQRSPYAGKAPVGYPIIETITQSGISNRFGDGDETATTIRLPLEALGDAELVNRLMKLPKERQPFWLINWQALEAQRNSPQTFPQRPNPFTGNNVN